MKRPGFTILELLIALVVISVLAALAIPAYFSRPEVTLENAAVLLARDLRMAQNRAAYSAEPLRFEFFPEGNGYRVVDLEHEIVQHPATLQDFVRIYSQDAVFHGVEIVDVATAGERVLVYDPRGQPNGEARITLTFEGDLRTILVDGYRGRITVLGSTSGWVDDTY